jgi:hypothetical protein
LKARPAPEKYRYIPEKQFNFTGIPVPAFNLAKGHSSSSSGKPGLLQSID